MSSRFRRNVSIGAILAASSLAVAGSAPTNSRAEAVPVVTEPHCRSSRFADEAWIREEDALRLRSKWDLDGDRVADLLEAERTSGSIATSTSVGLVFSGGAPPVEASAQTFVTSIVNVDPVPAALTSGRLDDSRSAIEDALFARICDGIDPSLAWWIDEPKRLRWIAGRPVLPVTYTVRLPRMALERTPVEGEVWLTYLGAVHGSDRELVELATAGDVVLLGTPHGVIRTDARRSRHAWLYVHSGGEKLRWPSIAGAEIRDGRAVVRFRSVQGADPLEPVTIDLDTGVVVRDLALEDPRERRQTGDCATRGDTCGETLPAAQRGEIELRLTGEYSQLRFPLEISFDGGEITSMGSPVRLRVKTPRGDFARIQFAQRVVWLPAGETEPSVLAEHPCCGIAFVDSALVKPSWAICPERSDGRPCLPDTRSGVGCRCPKGTGRLTPGLADEAQCGGDGRCIVNSRVRILARPDAPDEITIETGGERLRVATSDPRTIEVERPLDRMLPVVVRAERVERVALPVGDCLLIEIGREAVTRVAVFARIQREPGGAFTCVE